MNEASAGFTGVRYHESRHHAGGGDSAGASESLEVLEQMRNRLLIFVCCFTWTFPDPVSEAVKKKNNLLLWQKFHFSI